MDEGRARDDDGGSRRSHALSKPDERSRSTPGTGRFTEFASVPYRCRNDKQRSSFESGAAIAELTGFNSAELASLGPLHFGDLVHDEDRDAVWAAVQEAVRGERAFSIVYRLLDRKGQARWVHDHGRADVSVGDTVHIIGTITPIGDLRLIEDALDRSRREARAVLDASPIPMLSLALDGTVRTWNRAAEQVFGWRAEEVVGAPLPIVSDEYQSEYAALRASVAAGRKFTGQESIRRRKNGDEIVVRLSAAPIIEADGTVSGVMAAIEDVTEERRRRRERTEIEQRFLTFFEESRVAKAMAAPDGRLTRVNDAACRMLGYDALELSARTITDITHPDDRERVATAVRACLEGAARDIRIEKRYLRKDGAVVWAEVTSTLVRDEAGKPRFFATESVDVTERVLSRRRLRRQTELLQTVLDHVPLLIGVIDEAGRAQWVDAEWTRVLGWPVRDDDDADFIALCAPNRDDRDKAQELVRLANGSWIDLRVVAHDGRTLDMSWAAVKLSRGRVLVIGRDVTEQLSAQAREHELERQLRHAQRLDALGRLAGGVAHDLNNLLMPILGNADLLLELEHEERARAALEETRAAALSARRLVGQLLAFGRQQHFHVEVLSVNALVRDFESMVRRLIGEDIDLRVVLDDDAGCVRVDRSHFEQVLLNLVVNAREAMPHGGVLTVRTEHVLASDATLACRCETLPGNSYVRLVVEDTGSGIEESIRDRIFDPFFSTKPADRGAGLGLSTVYGIVQQLGGGVTVESEVGRGSTFYVCLPRVAAADVASGAHEAATAPSQLSRHRILVVEDDDGVRAVVTRYLERCGHDVVAVNGPEAALAFVRTALPTPDVLLTDVVMPGMRGPALRQAMAASNPSMRVIFMSGYAEDALETTSGTLRPAAFLQKPFTLAALKRALDDVLRAE